MEKTVCLFCIVAQNLIVPGEHYLRRTRGSVIKILQLRGPKSPFPDSSSKLWEMALPFFLFPLIESLFRYNLLLSLFMIEFVIPWSLKAEYEQYYHRFLEAGR